MPMVAAAMGSGFADGRPIASGTQESGTVEPATIDAPRIDLAPAVAMPIVELPAAAIASPAASTSTSTSTSIFATSSAPSETNSTRANASPADIATHAEPATRTAAAAPDRCGACRARASPLREVRAASLYRAPLDRLLPRFKFHHDLAAGRLLATTMAAAFAPLAGRDAAVCATLIPVPLHRSRLRQRGYDQALELARPLSRRLGLPLRANGLHRARDTPPQSRLDAAQRRRNLRDAFAWRTDAPPPAHAILIDDVMTTGATLHAAAQALQRAGAGRVDAWVCARTL